MKAACARQNSLRGLVRCEETRPDGSTSTRFVECWIDVKGGRVRTEVREQGRASPKLAIVAGPEGMRLHQLELDELAEERRELDLPTALAASFAGELLSTGFRGELLTFKAEAYGRPELLSGGGEEVGGVGCTKVRFSGNREAELWIGDADLLPRRIRGPLPGATLVETIVRLDPGADLRRVEFEIPVPEGRRLPAPAEVRERWSRPPPEPERWPRPEEDAPDFAALDLDATPHLLSETAEQEVVLAFWTAEDDRSPELAAQAERAWREAASKPLFLHVAAGSERTPVARAATRNGMKQPVWVAGCHPDDAFRAWRIWTCPVFARVRDMQVVAVTRDLEAVCGWFR